MGLAALLPYVLSAASSAYGAWSSSSAYTSGVEATNEASIQQAREARAWEERMYKTRHQMEVDDLKAAGLNPILSAFIRNIRKDRIAIRRGDCAAVKHAYFCVSHLTLPIARCSRN